MFTRRPSAQRARSHLAWQQGHLPTPWSTTPNLAPPRTSASSWCPCCPICKTTVLIPPLGVGDQVPCPVRRLRPLAWGPLPTAGAGSARNGGALSRCGGLLLFYICHEFIVVLVRGGIVHSSRMQMAMALPCGCREIVAPRGGMGQGRGSGVQLPLPPVLRATGDACSCSDASIHVYDLGGL